MKIITSISEMKGFSQKCLDEHKTIGFVPTMGYLHDGHLSLVSQARKKCDIVVMTIYVNPTQFNENDDFEKYPRDLERDQELARAAGVDVLFFPNDSEMYPQGKKLIDYKRDLFDTFEGASRKNHFNGVVTIVSKLFEIVKPTHTFFGAKDYQQCIVIKQMIHDLNYPIEIFVCPTVRERDGLAMSSRNARLTSKQREIANTLYQGLLSVQKLFSSNETNVKKIKDEIRKQTNEKITFDYIAIVEENMQHEFDETISTDSAIVLVAAYIGEIRLIDNIKLKR